MGSHNTRIKHRQICFPLPCFTSSPDDTDRGIPSRKAPCSGLTHLQFSASPPKPGTCNKPSRKASFPLSQMPGLFSSDIRDKPKGSHHRSEPGQLLTGSGLGHGPAARHRLDPPSRSASPFRFLLSFHSPPPQALPGNPTLFFSIHPQSSSQQPKHLWTDTRAMGMSEKQLWRSPTRQRWWQSSSRVNILQQRPCL